jgi:DNA processing protein
MTDQEKIYHIALSMQSKVGPVTAKSLISYCGSVENVFKATKKQLTSIPGVGDRFVATFDPTTTLNEAEAEYKYAQKNDISVLAYTDAKYPKRLTYFDYSPIVLYYKGQGDLNHHRTVAVVGTRMPSDYGKVQCERIIEGMAHYDILLVSGLAYGVDGVAHRQCLASGISTVGVLGHGHDRIYPSDHQVLARKMVEEGGGVLTEFPINTRPDRENFPMRNRIIAALSDAIIVIESKRSGGSIITAEFGNEYNKDVFALPGPVNVELSEGCNKLIKQNKAHLLESAADIAYIMRWDDIDKGKIIQKQLFVDLEPDETVVIDYLRTHKETSIDAITYALSISPSAMSSVLLGLEFKGLVRCLPGKKYCLS